MMEFLADAYPWIKALHIISVIAWMAAMLYLPRLFVYHAGVDGSGPESAVFKVMERRLARAIMTPAMIATWVFGLALAATPGIVDWGQDIWFHGKFALVIALTALHGYLISCMRAFATGGNRRSGRFYRVINEVPAAIMVAVVILVIVRPL
jgi:putative membrane protein